MQTLFVEVQESNPGPTRPIRGFSGCSRFSRLFSLPLLYDPTGKAAGHCLMSRTLPMTERLVSLLVDAGTHRKTPMD